MTFQGVDRVLVGWAKQHFAVRFGTKTPADLAQIVPFGKVQTIGGPSNDNASRVIGATVSFDFFAADEDGASDFAWDVDAGLRDALPGAIYSGVTFGQVRTLTIPGWRPWDDTAVQRYGATYQIWLTKPPQ